MKPPQKKDEPPRPLRILIGLPNRGHLTIEMSLNLMLMLHLLSVNPYQRIDGELRTLLWYVEEVRNSLLPQSRQTLVDKARENDVDYLLFIDDDMIFDPEFIFDWVRENRPLLAMNCPIRAIPCYPTARTQSERHPFKGELVYSDIANMRWQRVWRVGTGIMMIRKDVLQKLPRPCFTPRWEPGNDHYVGEDWAFCEEVEKLGVPIIIDNKQSLEVKHVGQMAFAHEMIVGTRKQIAAQSGIMADPAIVHKKLIVPGA